MRQEEEKIRKKSTGDDEEIMAEVYAARAIREEMEKTRIREGSRVWRMIVLMAAKVIMENRQEIRDIYQKSKERLREWIIKESGLCDWKALAKFNEIGLTGNVLKDMEIMGMKIL